jgi:hypothetical protein
MRYQLIAALAASALATAFAGDAMAGGSLARPATKSERAAIMKSFVANDGSISGVDGVYVSRANTSLAVVCQRTPEAGVRAYVFGRTHSSWHYLTSGSPGRAGSPTDRRLERACP